MGKSVVMLHLTLFLSTWMVTMLLKLFMGAARETLYYGVFLLCRHEWHASVTIGCGLSLFYGQCDHQYCWHAKNIFKKFKDLTKRV